MLRIRKSVIPGEVSALAGLAASCVNLAAIVPLCSRQSEQQVDNGRKRLGPPQAWWGSDGGTVACTSNWRPLPSNGRLQQFHYCDAQCQFPIRFLFYLQCSTEPQNSTSPPPSHHPFRAFPSCPTYWQISSVSFAFISLHRVQKCHSCSSHDHAFVVNKPSSLLSHKPVFEFLLQARRKWPFAELYKSFINKYLTARIVFTQVMIEFWLLWLNWMPISLWLSKTFEIICSRYCHLSLHIYH